MRMSVQKEQHPCGWLSEEAGEWQMTVGEVLLDCIVLSDEQRLMTHTWNPHLEAQPTPVCAGSVSAARPQMVSPSSCFSFRGKKEKISC